MVMKMYQNNSYKLFLSLVIIGIIIGFSVGCFIFSYKVEQNVSSTITTYSNNPNFYQTEINLVAVDQDGNGVITPLIVEIKSGNGKALTNIDKLLFWVDTQQSIQIAKNVAENVTGINASDYDLTYSIESNATLIGGPSAGAALTIATVAALERKTLKDDVMITGTINPDGTVGAVGGILEKARAAKEEGAKLFLVPSGQSEQTYLQPVENCVRRGGLLWCQTTYNQITVNIGKDVGISVIEIDNIKDAIKYFI